MTVPVSLVKTECDQIIDKFDYYEYIAPYLDKRYQDGVLQVSALVIEISEAIYELISQKYDYTAILVLSFHGWNLCNVYLESSEFTFKKKFEKTVKEMSKEIKSNDIIMSPKAVAKVLYMAYKIKYEYYSDEKFDRDLMSFEFATDANGEQKFRVVSKESNYMSDHY
ncbi:hypothetical protein [Cysteiniphilum marinum]|uniref:hypothetical protein n=1 Tax=Cysteiniphilum marinum TaxID=2774191 RepID=UPI00193C5BB9|nr:hypothetical protein [Cysteiniphilum marinum]